MANQSGLLNLNSFKKDLSDRLKELLLVQQKHSTFISPESLSDFKLINEMIGGIILREMVRDTSGTYDPNVNRPEHTSGLEQLITSLDEKINNPSPSPSPPSARLSPIAPGSSSASIRKNSNNGDTGSSRRGGKGGSRSTSSRSSGPFYCQHQDCQLNPPKFPYQSKLKDHQRKHGPPKFQCQFCTMPCKQSRILKKHIERKHRTGGDDTSSQAQEGEAFPQEPEPAESYCPQNLVAVQPQPPISEHPIDPRLDCVDPKDLEWTSPYPYSDLFGSQ